MRTNADPRKSAVDSEYKSAFTLDDGRVKTNELGAISQSFRSDLSWFTQDDPSINWMSVASLSDKDCVLALKNKFAVKENYASANCNKLKAHFVRNF